MNARSGGGNSCPFRRQIGGQLSGQHCIRGTIVIVSGLKGKAVLIEKFLPILSVWGAEKIAYILLLAFYDCTRYFALL